MTTNAATDIDLLRRVREGNSSAFHLLYQRHQGPLFRFILMRSGSPDTAADIVQEVFMGLLANSFRFDPLRGQLQNFLFGVGRNLLMKHEAPRLRAVSSDDEDEPFEEEASEEAEPLRRLLHNEQAEAVRRALSQLAPHYRDCVILYALHDMSYLEIADICQLDIGTVRSRLSRARAALVTRLRPSTSFAA